MIIKNCGHGRPCYLLAAFVGCTPLAAHAVKRPFVAKKKAARATTPSSAAARASAARAAAARAAARREAVHQSATLDALAQAAALHPVITVRSAQIVDPADDDDTTALPPVSDTVVVVEAPGVTTTATTTTSTTTTVTTGAAGATGADTVVSPAAVVVEDEDAPGPPGPPGPPALGATADEDAPAAAVGAPDSDGIGTGSDVGAPATRTRDSFVEAGFRSSRLSDGFGTWGSIYLRSQLRLSDVNTLAAEVERSREFGDSGTFIGLGITHIINDDWFSSISGGTSTGGFYLPRARVDAFINRKLLRQRNLVATLGAGYYRARDVYTDRSLFAGATYYFAPRWIVEGGVRFNNSNPGSIGSTSQFAALTYGEDKKRFITARIGNGREAYQLIGPNLGLVDFASNEASLTIRQWFGSSRGINLVLERYSNPSYKRRGVSLGYFQDF